MLIWTRSAADWDEDRELLPPETLHLPCIVREPLVRPIVLDYKPDIVIVTSAYIPVVLRNFPDLQEQLAKAKFCCFGKKTRQRLEKAGYEVYSSEDEASDAGEFASVLIDVYKSVNHFTHLSGRKFAFDLIPYMKGAGLKKHKRIILYRTKQFATHADGGAVSRETRAEIARGGHVICFASPSAVRGFVNAFWDYRELCKENFFAVAIGDTTLREVARYFRHRCKSSAHTLASLVSTAKDVMLTQEKCW